MTEEPARPSAWRGGRVPNLAVSATVRPESPASVSATRPPSPDHGWAPASTRAMPTLGGIGVSGRPTSSGAAGSAGETAVAWRSLKSAISPGRSPEASTWPASAIAAPRSSRRGETPSATS